MGSLADKKMNKIFAPTLFKGKVNIVTGGGTGIGFGVAKGLVQLGSKVVIASRKQEVIDEAKEKLEEFKTEDAEIVGLTVDIRDRDSLASLVSNTLETFGRLDGLCNNGGGQFQAKGQNISSKGWDAVVKTNLYGTWNMMQEAFDQHMKENGGQIVNIVTTNRTGMAGLSHTGAARAGVKSLSQSMGAEWMKYGISINNVGPGVFASPTAIANYGPLGEILFGNTAKITPAGKIGDVDAHLVAPIIFMLSPGVCYTTGQTLDVCGGVSLYNHYYQPYMKITQLDNTE